MCPPILPLPPPHQSRKDASQLDDVGVGDRVEAADPRVGDGDERREDDGRVQVHLDDDGEGGAWMRGVRVGGGKFVLISQKKNSERNGLNGEGA